MLYHTPLIFYLILGVQGKPDPSSDLKKLAELTNSVFVKRISYEFKSCNFNETKCKDCRTAVSCVGNRFQDIPCEGLFPYCDEETGSCSANPVECHGVKSKFNCPSDGIFPDLESCQSFHVCHQNEELLMSCTDRLVYSHTSRKCELSSINNQCHTFSCSGKNGRYVPYRVSGRLFTFCSNGSPIQLFNCSEDQVFVERDQVCRKKCLKEGEKVPDLQDKRCAKFFYCTQDLVPVRRQCASGRWFNPSNLICELKDDDFVCPNFTKTNATFTGGGGMAPDLQGLHDSEENSTQLPELTTEISTAVPDSSLLELTTLSNYSQDATTVSIGSLKKSIELPDLLVGRPDRGGDSYNRTSSKLLQNS